MPPVISVENLSKFYRLGQIGTGTFAHDLSLWLEKVRGMPNSSMKIGKINHGNQKGDEIWALRDLSFSVQQGEVLGIIGRNGAGKSTLLKILSRVTAPTSGRIRVKGRVASLLEVGTGFHPELTGRENVYLNGAILGMTRQEVNRNFDEIVDFAGVEKFIDTPVKRYSSGMYVRLAFAVAAHLEPEILVVDEVLAVGDAEFQKKCLGKMENVAREGRTVLFVSHNMASIRILCTKGLLLNGGRILCKGSVSEAIYTYTKGASTGEDMSSIGVPDVDFSLPSIIAENGEKIDCITPKDSFSVISKLTINKLIDNFDFYFIVKNSSDEVILVSRANAGEFKRIREPGVYHFQLKVPTLWLMPGQYNCHFKIIEYSIGSGQIRYLSNDFILDVTAKDKAPDLLLGRLDPEIEWTVS